jgi:hypothetical protein
MCFSCTVVSTFTRLSSLGLMTLKQRLWVLPRSASAYEKTSVLWLQGRNLTEGGWWRSSSSGLSSCHIHPSAWKGRFSEVCEMNVVVTSSAREMFAPRELTAAYEQFKEHGPQYLSAETGIRAAAYQFGSRVLIVYQESETDVVVLIHRSA